MKKKHSLKDKITVRLEQIDLAKEVELMCENPAGFSSVGLLDYDDENETQRENICIPYIGFKRTKQSTNSRSCRSLTSYLLRELKKSQSEITGIRYYVNRHERRLNACLVLNPEAEVLDTEKFIHTALSSLNNALEQYMYHHKINDPFRN